MHRSVHEDRNSIEAQQLLKSLEREVNQGNIKKAEKHFTKTFRILSTDKPGNEMTSSQWLRSLSKDFHINPEKQMVLPVDKTVKIGFENSDKNIEMFTTLDTERQKNGKMKFVDGIQSPKPKQLVKSARGTPSLFDDPNSSYHYDQEPSTSGGSGSGLWGSSSSNRDHRMG